MVRPVTRPKAAFVCIGPGGGIRLETARAARADAKRQQVNARDRVLKVLVVPIPDYDTEEKVRRAAATSRWDTETTEALILALLPLARLDTTAWPAGKAPVLKTSDGAIAAARHAIMRRLHWSEWHPLAAQRLHDRLELRLGRKPPPGT